MVRLTVQIADFIQSFEIPVPEVPTLPQAPTVPPVPSVPAPPTTSLPAPQYTPPPPPTVGKLINISTLTNAFRTQNIPILVTAICGDPPGPINGEDATLFIDGQSVATQTVRNGTAQFFYTFKDAGLHKIQVTIPKSMKCPSEGSSSLQIDVSSEVPSTLERLRIEEQAKQAALEQIEAIRQQTRQLLTQTPTIPSTPQLPGV